MTPSPVRSKVAVVTAALGVAVLLAGPAGTFGLGVPVVGDGGSATTQVTNTVQGAVDTTQQTAATTVIQVESTVQTTTQAVAPAPAAAPQPAPAPATSAPAVTKQVTTRVATPVEKHVAVGRPQTRTAAAAAPNQLVTQTGVASAAPARIGSAERTRVTRVTRAQVVRAPSRTTAARAQGAPTGCTVPVLAALPGGSQLQALLAIVCAAAGGLDLPGPIGLVPGDAGVPVAGDVHAASARGTAGPRGPQLAVPAHGPRARAAVRPAGAATATQAATSQPAGSVRLPVALGAGRGGALVYVNSVQAANVTPASAATGHAADGVHHHHHGFLSGQSRGTELLMAILFANLSILGGIALWRLAVRFVIPRFA
jgi:hypothetical protein